jgi:2-keto-myo-inositol isomerase
LYAGKNWRNPRNNPSTGEQNTMRTNFDRRMMLTTVGAAAASLALGGSTPAAEPVAEGTIAMKDRFRYCLNTSTIRGQKITIEEEIELAAKAGYDAIEPWMGEIGSFLERGGKLSELKQRIADAGLTVESAIGFAAWIVDDDEQRKQALENARRDMDQVAQIGGKRIAAPPVGATKQTDLNLFSAAERYRALLEIGAEIGVTPQLEVWGFSTSLSRLGETAFVAIESGRTDACILPDVYHIYKGGSDFAGLNMLAGKAIQVFHMNDYPADPPRERIGDDARVWPGDGVAPLGEILRGLAANGFDGHLSLELFNREYWQLPAADAARIGLEKMQASVEAAFA